MAADATSLSVLLLLLGRDRAAGCLPRHGRRVAGGGTQGHGGHGRTLSMASRRPPSASYLASSASGPELAPVPALLRPDASGPSLVPGTSTKLTRHSINDTRNFILVHGTQYLQGLVTRLLGRPDLLCRAQRSTRRRGKTAEMPAAIRHGPPRPCHPPSARRRPRSPPTRSCPLCSAPARAWAPC